MPSTRRVVLLDAAYDYVLTHGIVTVSLRPLADAIGSSTGVLRFVFGSRDGLVDALLARAATEEQAVLDAPDPSGDLVETGVALWLWLAAPQHRPALALWAECYAASLREPDSAYARYAHGSVDAWLAALARAQPPRARTGLRGTARRTAVAALLRGCVLDLLATGELSRTTRAVRDGLGVLAAGPQ